MRALCPNDPEHDEFLTTAHVVEEWRVDREGNFLELAPPDGSALEVSHGADPANIWTCAICGADARVEP